MSEYALIIDAKKVATADTFTVTNPSTSQVIAEAPDASLDDLNSAVASAKKAFTTWSQVSDAQRAQACRDIAAKISEHSEELAELLTKEQGKPLNGLGSRWELGGAQAWAAATAELELAAKVIQDSEAGRIEQHRRPLGVVASITPWNFPVMIAVWHLLPAIRTGNTAVIKPSPYTPLSTLRLVELINEVLPAGVVNAISSSDSTTNIGAAMSAHDDIAKVVFTGSCATGQKVYASAAATMKRLTLELGGNDAGIVLGDCDPQEIAEGLFWGAFVNNGQTCAALKRLYVHEDIYEEVCEALTQFAQNMPVGDGMDEDSILGPISNQMQYDKVDELVQDAKKHGRVLIGGEGGPGLFYKPTLIADLDYDHRLVTEEQFGPVLPIVKYSDIDEIVDVANALDVGLGGSVWSKDIERAKEIAARLECGSVWINGHGMLHPMAPFGGRKGSGVGVEFGEEGLKEYTDIQVIHA